MSANKPQRIVAELGRPETRAETAARKAETSANHRKRQTLNNLLYSLLAALALVAVIVLAVPQPAAVPPRNVNWSEVASQGAGSEPAPLIAPTLPKTWTANSAELRSQTRDGVDAWYIGFVTPSKEFIALTQGFNANDTWVAAQLDNAAATSSREIGGLKWTVYDNRNSGQDTGNVQYALTTTVGHSTVVLYGTAPTHEFDTLATATAAALNHH